MMSPEPRYLQKSFVNSLSFCCGMMLLNYLKELDFSPFEPFLMVFYCCFQIRHLLMLIPFDELISIMDKTW